MIRRRKLHGLLFLIILSALTGAAAPVTAPRFTARTLVGQVFTDYSLRGRVVLLQFWTTW